MQTINLPDLPQTLSLTDLRTQTTTVRWLLTNRKAIMLLNRSSPIGWLLPIDNNVKTHVKKNVIKPKRAEQSAMPVRKVDKYHIPANFELKTVNVGKIKIPLTREYIYED